MLHLYRLAHLLWRWHIPVLPSLLKHINRALFAVVLPPSARVGRKVLFSYSGLVTVIHKRAVIGDGCVVGTGVTVGGRAGHEGIPVLGCGVMVGSGAKVLGPITNGDGAAIGANAVVLNDVPANGVAVGIPARVVRIMVEGEAPDYSHFSQAHRVSRDD